MNLFFSVNKLSKNLQGDIIKIAGKKIYINPFLYFRRLDKNTKMWFLKISQFSESEIFKNRVRFYPEVQWNDLTQKEKDIKNSTIELFLKTLEIIKTFHPNLSLEQLDIVERNLVIFRKIPFEKWVNKQFKKKSKFLLKEKTKLERANFVNNWQKWLNLRETQKLLGPVFVTILLAALIGWFAGISKNSCNPYFESASRNKL